MQFVPHGNGIPVTQLHHVRAFFLLLVRGLFVKKSYKNSSYAPLTHRKMLLGGMQGANQRPADPLRVFLY